MVTGIALVVIWVLLAFAAEPSTSTEYDVKDGRGIAAVQARATEKVLVVASSDDVPHLLGPLSGLLAVLALALTVASGASSVVRRVAVLDARHPQFLRGTRASRRGPPVAA